MARHSEQLTLPGSYYSNDFDFIDTVQIVSICLPFPAATLAVLSVHGLDLDYLGVVVGLCITLIPVMITFVNYVLLIEFASRMLVNYVAKKGYFLVFSEGYSMWPTIGYFSVHVNRRVTRFNYKDLKVGNIVVFNDPSYPVGVQHRIISVSKKQKTVTTKGDGNANGDSPIKFSQIVGIDTGFYFSFDRVWHLYLMSRLIIRRLYRWIRFRKNPLKCPKRREYYYPHTMADYIE
tara:strand:- start:480 stop:1181 length:702 start_codon:yes stop_codon:yes gene_type:complete